MSKLIYEVFITFNEIKGSQIEQFIESNLKGVTLNKLEGNSVHLIWPVSNDEGVHEVEEVLYYLVDDKELGDWTCQMQ